MDDGGKLDYNKNSTNTQSFTEKEVEQMSQELSTKFNLSCDIRSNKGKKIIIIKSTSYSIFRDIVDPYLITEMKYKLP